MNQRQAAAKRAIALRREIHRNPELGNRENRTSALVADTLTALGWEVTRPVGTSVMATLRGAHPGRTVALRADMDALPIREATGLPFESAVDGVMHACGHDFHTAGLLGAAMLLTPEQPRLHGSIRLLFQPDEEGDGGAQRMIAAGCLKGVDAVFGAHVDPDLPAGHIGVKYGKMYAASDMFRVVIHGASCHGASPDEGIDAIAVGAQVVTALQQIVSRRTSPTDSAVVTIGRFHAGSARNVVAEEAVLEGILRTLGPESRQRVRDQFRVTVSGVTAALGATPEVQIQESYPGVVNHDAMVDLVRDTAAALFGPGSVHVLERPTMGTEDFGYLIENVPGAFYKIGVRNPDIGAVHPIHSPRFIADDAAMANLIALHAGIVLRLPDAKV